LTQAVKSNTAAAKATRRGSEVGTRTAVDVVLAERSLARARSDHARARYDYILNTLRLKQAAGTLSPQDLVQVNSWLVQ
jgi:outer membrane protein